MKFVDEKLLEELYEEHENIIGSVEKTATDIMEFERTLASNKLRTPFHYIIDKGLLNLKTGTHEDVEMHWRRKPKACLPGRSGGRKLKFYIVTRHEGIITSDRALTSMRSDMAQYVPFFPKFIEKYKEYIQSKRTFFGDC